MLISEKKQLEETKIGKIQEDRFQEYKRRKASEIKKILGMTGICLTITGIIGFIMAYIYIFEPVLRISQITNNWIFLYVVDLKLEVTNINWDRIIGGVELYILLFIIDYVATRPVNDVLFLGLFKVQISDLIISLTTTLAIGIILSLIQILSKNRPELTSQTSSTSELQLSKQKNYKLLLGTIGSLLFSVPMIFLVAVENFAPRILSSYIQYIALYGLMGIGLVVLSGGFIQRNNGNKIFSIMSVILSFVVALLLTGHYLEKNYLYNKYYWSLEGFAMGPLGSFIYNTRLILPYIALAVATLLIAAISVIYGFKSFTTKNTNRFNKITRISGALMVEWGIMAFLFAYMYVDAKIVDLTIGIRVSQTYFFESWVASVTSNYMTFFQGLRTETLYDYLYIAGFLPLAVFILIYGLSYIFEIKQSVKTTKDVRKGK